MKRPLLICLLFALASGPLFSQLMYNDGADIYVQAGGLIYVQGGIQNQDNGANLGRMHNSGDIQLEEHWTNNSVTNVYDPGDPGTTTFIGTTVNPQFIQGTTETNFNNLTINKGGGVAEVRQNINSLCDGVLDLTNDFLNTQTFNFGVNNTAINAIQRVGPIAPPYTNSMTEGYVTSNPGSAGRLIRATLPGVRYFYPVGNGTRFRPVEITTAFPGPNAYPVQFVNTATPNTGLLGPGIASINPNWFHFIERAISPGTTENITIYWDASNDGICDVTTQGLGEWDNSLWQDLGAVVTVSNATPVLSSTTKNAYPGAYPTPFVSNRFVLTDNIFDPWGPPCTLPVEMLSLKATPLSESIMVDWKTVTEWENLGFDLERSEDGINFEYVDFFQGQGTTQEATEYAYEDADVVFEQTYYYRLRQQDLNGASRYSDVVEARLSMGGREFELSDFYPNPADGQNNLRIVALENMDINMEVYNHLGQLVHVEDFAVAVGVNEVAFDFDELASGQYVAKLQANGQSFQKRFVLK